MTIKVGDKIPALVLKRLIDEKLVDLPTEGIFKGKKVVLFGIPGAFTPTCSVEHLPGYVRNFEAFKSLGIDVVCVAVNDPFVIDAWAIAFKANNIQMMPDGNGTFTKALGLEMDGSSYGLGTRTKRFALYAEDGVVKHIVIEKPGEFGISGADNMLEVIKGLN